MKNNRWGYGNEYKYKNNVQKDSFIKKMYS